MKEFVFSPHYDFFIDKVHRIKGYEMRTFHLHKKYEIYFQAEGTRRYYINDSAYLVNAGSVVLIGQDSVHKTSSVDNSPHTRYVINFSADYLNIVQSVMPNVDLLACFKSGVAVIPLSGKKLRYVETLLSSLWEGYSEQSEAGTALRRMQMSTFLIYLAKYSAEALLVEAKNGKITNPTIEKIQEHISTHYKDELSLSLIAAQFYISPYYLSRLFKKTTNLSIVEYINSVRVMAAKTYLESGKLSVERIADETGFSTTSHFSRVFKDTTGLSPQKYRKLNKI